MANEALNFFVENLLQLLSENAVLIKGVEDEFKDLFDQVQLLKAFVDDAVIFQSNSSLWDQLVKDIQKMIHNAEDVIDKFLVQSKQHREDKKVGRFFDASHLETIRALTDEIKGIGEKVMKLREESQESFQPRPVLELPKRGHEITQGDLLLDDDEVVGFNEEADNVIKRLIEGPEESLDIIAVVGMPGLGKTILARNIYNDPKLSYEFLSILWFYVGREYKIKDIYLRILKFFTKRIEDHLNDDWDTLAKVISGLMSNRGRCLIILDDVWEAEVIDYVKKVFAENEKGHRIMMITHDRYLAAYANAEPHILKFLTAEECFQLLENRVFGKGSCPDELKELGKRIAQNCCGVPIVVVVIAGVLRGLSTRNDWQRVERNMAQHLHSNYNRDWDAFVEMSYDCLPQEVKTCFLYCGIFPPDFDIPAWKLIRMWIAEGLIKPQQSYTLEEIAEHHLKDLVNRNLVMLLQKKSDGKIKTCRLHGMLHEFCRTKAANKWLFQEICTTFDNSLPSIQDSDTCRRLCIQPSTLCDFLSTKPSAEHVRSFYCFSSKQKQTELSRNEIKLLHKAFPLMRVLDVESLKFIFSKDFNQLFHLRYIAISGDVKALHPPFGDFWNLQTLILNTSTSEPTLDVKADIWNLLQLRHLHTNIPAKLPSPTITTGKPSCLQTLSMVAPESCKKDVLAKARHLKKLSIRGQMEAFLESRSGNGISNLEELKCLEHLKLLNDVLYMNKTVQLPTAFFRLVRTVKKLTLANTRFQWSEAEKLAQLESLEVLKLKENAFMGDTWKPEVGGFIKLRVLWIERAELETWEASNFSYPILRNLVLVSCDKLNAIPFELADIPNLCNMKLDNTIKAVKSAKDILEYKRSKNIKFKLSIFPPEAKSKATQCS